MNMGKQNNHTPPSRVPSDALAIIEKYKTEGVLPMRRFGSPYTRIIKLEHVMLHKDQRNKFADIVCIYRNSYLVLFQKSFTKKETVPVFFEPLDVHMIANFLSALIADTDRNRAVFYLSDYKWIAKRSPRKGEDTVWKAVTIENFRCDLRSFDPEFRSAQGWPKNGIQHLPLRTDARIVLPDSKEHLESMIRVLIEIRSHFSLRYLPTSLRSDSRPENKYKRFNDEQAVKIEPGRSLRIPPLPHQTNPLYQFDTLFIAGYNWCGCR